LFIFVALKKDDNSQAALLSRKGQSCALTISVEEYEAYEHEQRVPVEGFPWILCPPRKSTPVKKRKNLKGEVCK
jgi:hypothetical protein